jgi:hypothetical protein
MPLQKLQKKARQKNHRCNDEIRIAPCAEFDQYLQLEKYSTAPQQLPGKEHSRLQDTVNTAANMEKHGNDYTLFELCRLKL